MKQLLHYLNPIAHLGDKKYSYIFPFTTTLATSVLLEFYVNVILKNPGSVGNYAIFLFVALIMYFSFRDGILGGSIVTVITILYYFYLIRELHYTGTQYTAGIVTTIILGILYFILAGIIGGLKQKIDTLIEREADERRRLETILQQLPVGVLITDNKGKVLQVNKQLDKMLGAKFPTNFTVGKEVFFIAKTNGKSITPSQAPLMHVLTIGKSISNKEYIIQRKDGKQRNVQVNASVIRNKRGKIIAAAQIISDITQQKELETRKDDFVNMASHELKTPITSLKLYIDLLMNRIKNYNDEKTLKLVRNTKSQAEKLQELVNDLLDVSRMQTGKLSFNKEKFRLDEAIRETVEDLQTTTKQTITFSKPIPFIVYADKFRIYQVITNLITNAIKYSPENKEIKIRIKRFDGKAIISVRDNGIGIAKDQQKKIFDRLYQVVEPKKKSFPGFGMGLYITKEIIKRHQGAIWVESEKGKGSTFFVSLPLQKK